MNANLPPLPSPVATLCTGLYPTIVIEPGGFSADQMHAYARSALAAQAAELAALRADAERLDWLFRQDLDDLVLQLVRDTYHDGEYCVHGDDGALGYGKTPREAIDAARAALKEQKT